MARIDAHRYTENCASYSLFVLKALYVISHRMSSGTKKITGFENLRRRWETSQHVIAAARTRFAGKPAALSASDR